MHILNSQASNLKPAPRASAGGIEIGASRLPRLAPPEPCLQSSQRHLKKERDQTSCYSDSKLCFLYQVNVSSATIEPCTAAVIELYPQSRVWYLCEFRQQLDSFVRAIVRALLESRLRVFLLLRFHIQAYPNSSKLIHGG